MALEDMLLTLVNVIISAAAIIISIYTYMKSKKESVYSDLDSMYMELLETGIEHPKFRNPKYTKDYETAFTSEDERIQYETYAYMCWNFCETIFDRSSKDNTLLETWAPACDSENLLHRKWFENPAISRKFKKSFREFVKNRVIPQ